MRKNLIFLTVILIIVTGCGNTKKIECVANEDGYKTTVKLVYNDDLLDDMTVVYEYDNSNQDLTNDQINELENFICGMFSSENVNCIVNRNTNTVDVTIKLDFDKMSEEEMEIYGYTKENIQYDIFKADIEKEGYTCK